MKFQRGENEPCVYYHEDMDLLIIIYVDDLLIDGTQENVLRFITLLRDRFECKDPETLTIKHSIDYVGINISQNPHFNRHGGVHH